MHDGSSAKIFISIMKYDAMWTPCGLQASLFKAFDTKIHMLQITSGNVDSEKARVENDMIQFADLNGISNYQCHLINDKDVENGVIHFNQMINMDIEYSETSNLWLDVKIISKTIPALMVQCYDQRVLSKKSSVIPAAAPVGKPVNSVNV